METLKAFFEKVKSDENLQNEIKKLNEAKDQEAFIALAKSCGVSEEGIKQAWELMKDAENKQLSDGDLEEVSGGIVFHFPKYIVVNGVPDNDKIVK